ncbi:MAG: ASPIC/UnbV domain-containing protein, partial [Holophagales bacterium]|nr:ASPIC/UnbV domain-containing protein [Holophagales bacterium]
RTVWSLVGTGGSFGASSLQAEIGLGKIERITGLEIRWPDARGTVETLGSLVKNRIYLVVRGEAPVAVDIRPATLGPGLVRRHSHPAKEPP